jgi:hypothetical protein
VKIFSLRSIGVRGLADAVYSFASAPDRAHDRVLLVGPSASGKTRLLDLIVAVREVISPSDERIDQDPFVRIGNNTARAVVTFWLAPEERALIGASEALIDAEVVFNSDTPEEQHPGLVFLFERYAHDDQTPKLEYFSEKRRLDIGGGEMSLGEERQQRYRTTNSVRKLAFLPRFLDRLPKQPDQARRFARGVASLSRALRYDIEQHALMSGHRKIGDLGELSASEADAVSFAATAALVGLSRSIVLVDRPELHGLDPVRAFHGISALGEENQVIAATSAPELHEHFRSGGFQGGVITLDSAAKRF